MEGAPFGHGLNASGERSFGVRQGLSTGSISGKEGFRGRISSFQAGFGFSLPDLDFPVLNSFNRRLIWFF